MRPEEDKFQSGNGETGAGGRPLGSGRRPRGPRIVIVGVCGSGKSLLTNRLVEAGYDARQVSQEHSLVPHLFRNCDPDFVVLLEAGDDTVARRKHSGWKPAQLQAQRERLRLAREEADIVLATDTASPDELVARVRREIDRRF